jgi:hypothetical protein
VSRSLIRRTRNVEIMGPKRIQISSCGLIMGQGVVCSNRQLNAENRHVTVIFDYSLLWCRVGDWIAGIIGRSDFCYDNDSWPV